MISADHTGYRGATLHHERPFDLSRAGRWFLLVGRSSQANCRTPPPVSFATARSLNHNLRSEIVKRIRAMATKLLPVQVEISDISDATSSIITPEVVAAFAKCGGDFAEAVPFWYVMLNVSDGVRLIAAFYAPKRPLCGMEGSTRLIGTSQSAELSPARSLPGGLCTLFQTIGSTASCLLVSATARATETSPRRPVRWKPLSTNTVP